MEDVCSVCLEEFVDARYLPCGNFHAFCMPCAEAFVKCNQGKGCFPCPLCRNNVTIPPGGAQAFHRVAADVGPQALSSPKRKSPRPSGKETATKSRKRGRPQSKPSAQHCPAPKKRPRKGSSVARSTSPSSEPSDATSWPSTSKRTNSGPARNTSAKAHKQNSRLKDLHLPKQAPLSKADKPRKQTCTISSRSTSAEEGPAPAKKTTTKSRKHSLKSTHIWMAVSHSPGKKFSVSLTLGEQASPAVRLGQSTSGHANPPPGNQSAAQVELMHGAQTDTHAEEQRILPTATQPDSAPVVLNDMTNGTLTDAVAVSASPSSEPSDDAPKPSTSVEEGAPPVAANDLTNGAHTDAAAAARSHFPSSPPPDTFASTHIGYPVTVAQLTPRSRVQPLPGEQRHADSPIQSNPVSTRRASGLYSTVKLSVAQGAQSEPSPPNQSSPTSRKRPSNKGTPSPSRKSRSSDSARRSKERSPRIQFKACSSRASDTHSVNATSPVFRTDYDANARSLTSKTHDMSNTNSIRLTANDSHDLNIDNVNTNRRPSVSNTAGSSSLSLNNTRSENKTRPVRNAWPQPAISSVSTSCPGKCTNPQSNASFTRNVHPTKCIRSFSSTRYVNQASFEVNSRPVNNAYSLSNTYRLTCTYVGNTSSSVTTTRPVNSTCQDNNADTSNNNYSRPLSNSQSSVFTGSVSRARSEDSGYSDAAGNSGLAANTRFAYSRTAESLRTLSFTRPWNATFSLSNSRPLTNIQPVNDTRPENDTRPVSNIQPMSDTNSAFTSIRPTNDTRVEHDTRPVSDTSPMNSTRPENDARPTNDTPPEYNTRPVNDTDPTYNVHPVNDAHPANDTRPPNDTDLPNTSNDARPVNNFRLVNNIYPLNSTQSSDKARPLNTIRTMNVNNTRSMHTIRLMNRFRPMNNTLLLNNFQPIYRTAPNTIPVVQRAAADVRRVVDDAQQEIGWAASHGQPTAILNAARGLGEALLTIIDHIKNIAP
ncbi:hypothetical protein BaRGS_00009679 [Batillaria attramentaria]|uniref:RING-type domain-containing protein n=1 Tax=Batillaria attramentaria TaxID=370345 RepID=A0ABD0LII8_9CAEN